MNDELFWRLKGSKRCSRCGSMVPKEKLNDKGQCLSCTNPKCFFCGYFRNLRFVEIRGMGCRGWVCQWHRRSDDIEVVE